MNQVEYQPLAAQTIRLLEALATLEDPLPPADSAQLRKLASQSTGSAETIASIQKILDRHCLIGVEINPESRVKVQQGPAKAELIQNGWRNFLVKVENQAGITAVLTPAALTEAIDTVAAIRLNDANLDYIVALIRATRETAQLSVGASPRAGALPWF